MRRLFSGRIAELETMNRILTDAARKRSERIKELEDEVDGLRRPAAHLKQELESMRREIERAREAINERDRELADLRKAMIERTQDRDR